MEAWTRLGAGWQLLAKGQARPAPWVTRRQETGKRHERGRLGAFQKNVVETNINSMSIVFENVSASESMLRDADMAEEISKLTLAQILVQSSIQVLSIANQIPTSVLQLIGA